MQRSLLVFCAGILASLSCRVLADESPVKDLIGRFAPAYREKIRLETIPATDGRDTYEVESSDGMVVLRGNTGVAQASAFYHYLKDVCHAHVSWNGDNFSLSPSPPPVPAKIRVVSPVVHRMAYNYCTHGYTMAFWDKARWDRELDWLALHGINRILVTEGQEAVWQRTFTRFGYSAEEVRLWLCSPAHQPWQFMQNMEGFMPPPQSLIEARADLGRHIVSRCRELGIEPILQGYYGMLPSDFLKKHPAARVFPQGTWAAGCRRPDMLDPGDPMYAEIAKTFMEEQRGIYGAVSYLAADPFHEGGTSKGMDRGTVYKQIQDVMLEFDPSITLVKQCWQTSNKEMFDAGRKDHSLALDLNCDYRPFWKKAKAYDGTPWAWCFLFNFGGNLALEGNPVKLAADFGSALTDPGRGKLEGTALVPEGSQTNPMMYELMTEMSMRGAPADVPAWVNQYLHARYGARDPSAEAAWKQILATAYSTPPAEGPVNSVLTARPRLDAGLRGRTWSPGSKTGYDNRELAKAWKLLLNAAPALGGKDTYRYDLADVSRQTLTNHSRAIFEQILKAVADKDPVAFSHGKESLLGIITDLEELCASRPDWLMGSWVADARKWGRTPEEISYMDEVSRVILTSWVANPQTDLADYANREWSGLLGEYYFPRWKMFLDGVGEALESGRDFDQKAFEKKRGEMEVKWIRSGKLTMPERASGDTVGISRKLLQKYGAEITALDPLPLVKLEGPRWDKNSFRYGSPARLAIPVSAETRADSEISVEFVYKSGANALQIDAVSLELDGEKFSDDVHEGWTGLETKSNRFVLSLPSGRSFKDAVLVARVRSVGGIDSNGEIHISGK
ncbi:MAG: alpha-N-acetylglucosaminidase [Luteolibacter sp.]|uniref:alpha-N-acetylglucosaminidase n=1 Tax=Luteolibacter sp. TaxID=1962973 RepID=UPI0032662B72